MPCVTIDVKTPKVSAFEKYAIDVEPIPLRQRSNRNVHHGYLNSLKDTLDILREIVEEARSELPSDSNLDYACVYTKWSQELLANASAACPKAVNKRDKFIATTPVTKKKRVTFADPLETSGNNTPKHVKQQSVQPTNVPILPSTGVNTATIASRSKPRSNTKKDKTLPAKSVPKKKVEDHPRNNKSKLSKKNRVDSCTSVSAQCPLTRKTTPKVAPVKIWKPTGRIILLRGQCPLTRPTALTSDVVLADPQAHHAPVDYNIVCSNQLDPNIEWGSNIILRRADNQEYTIPENDFKDLYSSDFEDLYLLNLQGLLPRDKKIFFTAVNLWIRNLFIRKRVEDFQLGIESYQTQLNLTKPRWEATGVEFIHDYKILDSPRAVLFRDKYGMQMLMRFNEIHKFSDGTLQQIDEALDYRVKEFKVNKINPGLNTRTWKALLVEEYKKETTDIYGKPNDDIFSIASSTSCVSYKDGKVRYEFPRSRQSQRDLPRDNLLVSVEVLRSDTDAGNPVKEILPKIEST
ncbi:hypothetical protein Tco_0277087 [Tanacetum coccineum]